MKLACSWLMPGQDVSAHRLELLVTGPAVICAVSGCPGVTWHMCGNRVVYFGPWFVGLIGHAVMLQAATLLWYDTDTFCLICLFQLHALV